MNLSKCRFNYPFLLWLILITLTFPFLTVLGASAASQISLEWIPNSEASLAGYKVFCREQSQSYDYANPSWEGTTSYCRIYDLDETKTFCFVARAFDSQGNESENSNEVCYEPSLIPNQPPTANAGPDQIVNEGQAVLLDGSNSTDPDDSISSYHWVQIGEPLVNLSNPDSKQLTFTAPDVGPDGAALCFELTVIDQSGNQKKDMCVVNVTWHNEPPQANAGIDQTVDEDTIVTLDGSSSLDIDDGIAAYQWTQIGFPEVKLSNPASSQPTFSAPKVGPEGACLIFNLKITDASGLQNTDSCIVNISWQNEPPTAVVSTDYMEAMEETLVTLDGSASRDPDGIASYLWTQVEGEPVSLSSNTSAVTTFIAPKTDSAGENLKFKLTVKDFGGLQGTAVSSVYVRQTTELLNNSPITDFNYVKKGRIATFTNQSTDSDGTIVSWFWNFGDGRTSTDKDPSHWYRWYGTYTITLTVTDNDGAKNSLSKTVTFSTQNRRWNKNVFLWRYR